MIDERKFMEFMTSLEEAGAECVSFDNLRKFVEEQSKINEWIPCSERLPNVSRCRVTLKYDMEVGPPAYETKDADFGRWRDGYGFRDDQMDDITCYVTAWQPLPEPYKGEVK